MKNEREEITAVLDKIQTWKDYHNKLILELMQPSEGLYMSDLFAITVLNRSLSLMRGFRSLVEERNYTCAAPIVRLQLDNALRFFALGLVPDHHDFVINVIKGVPVRKQKDRNGKPMTDNYLVGQVASVHPHMAWVKELYEKTSGYIHFSERHFLDTFDGKPPIPGEQVIGFRTLIGEGDAFIQDRDYIALAQDFEKSTDLVLALITLLAENKKQFSQTRN